MAESWRGGGTLIFNFSTMSTSLAWLGLARLDSTRLGLGRAHTRVSEAEGEARSKERERPGGSGQGSDLGSKMSGWQKCLNAITNLTFHITSKRQSLSQVNSSPSPSQSCERSPTYAPC